MLEALIGFAAFLALAFLRVPMAFAMGIVGFAGVAYKLNFNVAVGDDRAGDLRDRPRLHAVGDPAVHPDGQFRRACADVGGALSRRLLLPRPPARRARDVHGRRLRRLRRDLRLLDRDRGDLHQGAYPSMRKYRLQGHARRRLDRGRRHARHPDPAVGHHGDLRHHDRDQYRQAVRRRHHPGARRHRAPVPRGEVDHLARSRRRPAGRAAFLAGAPRRAQARLGGDRAVRAGDRRHLCRRLHRHRGRRHRRRRRVPVRAGAPGADLENPARRADRERAHHLDAVHDPDRRAAVRQFRQLHHACRRT